MNGLRHPRQDIYYWKCDRPAAFYRLQSRASEHSIDEIRRRLAAALTKAFSGSRIELQTGAGQGNHLTFTARIGDHEAFVRVEDGPDGDDYMEVEAHLLGELACRGIPVPEVLRVDATRREVPFAWQVLERVPHPDLNRHLKEGRLDLARIAPAIGAWVARWQGITPEGFGPFDLGHLRETGKLLGYHDRYADYFHVRLDEHLSFLVQRGFLTPDQRDEIQRAIDEQADLLKLGAGVLVHKDLALWNILGPADRIAVFIDWDDAVSGDPMDDISLLGCFHDGATLAQVLEGYATVRPLPADFRRRFWLHLLRNIIWKAVIRVGAGYFDRTSGFFLIGAGSSGADLRRFTEARLAAALRGLRADAEPSSLL
jgi:fructosamine-3-kinase